MKEIIDTWNINNRINLYLLESITEDNLTDVTSSKGRNIQQQFSHIHNVRLMWLKVSAPDLLKELLKIEKETKVTKKILMKELEKSGNAIAVLLEKGYKDGKIKGFKPHPSAFFGYLISHESHHRGQIILSLKQSGHPLEKKIQFGMWEWGSR